MTSALIVNIADLRRAREARLAAAASGRRHLQVVGADGGDGDRVCPRQVGDEGPCPFVSCRHHLWGMRARDGGMRSLVAAEDAAGPDRSVLAEQLAAMDDTCAIDVASRGPTSLIEIGEIYGLTRERIRQIEAKGLRRLQTSRKAKRELADFLDGPARYTKPVEPEDDGDETVMDLRRALNRIEPVGPGWRGKGMSSLFGRPGHAPPHVQEHKERLLSFFDRMGCASVAEVAINLGYATHDTASQALARFCAKGLLEHTELRGVYRRKGSSAQPTDAHRRTAAEHAAKRVESLAAARAARAAGVCAVVPTPKDAPALPVKVTPALAQAVRDRLGEMRRDGLLPAPIDLRRDPLPRGPDPVSPPVRPPLPPIPPLPIPEAALPLVTRTPESDAMGARILALVTAEGPLAPRMVRERLGLDKPRAEHAIRWLVVDGKVERLGKTNSARLAVPGDPRAAPPPPAPRERHAAGEVMAKVLAALAEGPKTGSDLVRALGHQAANVLTTLRRQGRVTLDGRGQPWRLTDQTPTEETMQETELKTLAEKIAQTLARADGPARLGDLAKDAGLGDEVSRYALDRAVDYGVEAGLFAKTGRLAGTRLVLPGFGGSAKPASPKKRETWAERKAREARQSKVKPKAAPARGGSRKEALRAFIEDDGSVESVLRRELAKLEARAEKIRSILAELEAA